MTIVQSGRELGGKAARPAHSRLAITRLVIEELERARPVASRTRLEPGAALVSMRLDQKRGRIEGEVRAPVVVISGRMDGDVHAAERVELTAKARVNGNLHYKVVEMAAGATLTGRLIHADATLAARTTGEVAAVAPIRGRNKAEAQEA